MAQSVRDVEQALRNVPMVDAHTHLVGGKLSARGLQDVLLYHMIVTELYAAGCPSGARLTEYPGWPSDEEAESRIEEAIPFLQHIRNTSTFWALRTLLADLYDWHEPLTLDNWRRLDGAIRERADDRTWPLDILNRVKITSVGTEFARREGGIDDDLLYYALEWAFFTRVQWGEYDTALYELERCWGRLPESPTPIGGARPTTERSIRTVDDVDQAISYYVDNIPFSQITAITNHISTDIKYRLVNSAEMSSALSNRAEAGPQERDTYSSYINEGLLERLEARLDRVVFQFSLGAEALPHETASRLSQATIGQLADMIARHPDVHFQCFLASRHANQSLCTLVRELPNLSLIGSWWHNFFPDTVRQVVGERLDMIPVNRHIAFFSDAYSVEWTYTKAVIIRRILAQVLAERIDRGQYTFDDAISIAGSILRETPETLLGMRPKQATAMAMAE